MSYLLIKFEKNYADEFDVYGTRIMTNTEWADYLNEAMKDTYPKEIYFGSNEQIEFDNYQDVVNSLTVELLSGEQAQTIQDKLGDEYGWFPHFGDY